MEKNKMKKGFVIKNKTRNEYVVFSMIECVQVKDVEEASFFFGVNEDKQDYIEEAKNNEDADEDDEFEAIDVEVTVKII